MPYADNNGVRLYWEEHGQGEPLLLIMGLGYSLEMWHRSLPVLAGHYRTIVFDNRGVGRSDVPPGPYPIATMAADAAAVMDAAGIVRAHVFGVSMGGMIAQELALQQPQRVLSLILGCTHCGMSKAVSADSQVISLLFTRATMTPDEAFEAMIPIVYDSATSRERIEEDFALRRLHYPTEQGYLAQLQGIMAWESASRLSGLSVPTLIIHGESDRLVPPENGRMLTDLIPGAKLVMLPHASHIFKTDQPEASNRVILEFLQEMSNAGSATPASMPNPSAI
jgi:pimeloyl-ACP methyl ester carboxylesterase